MDSDNIAGTNVPITADCNCSFKMLPDAEALTTLTLKKEEMETPLTWIKLLEPDVQSSAKLKDESMEHYVERVLKMQEQIESVKSIDDSDTGNNWLHKVDHIAGVLSIAAMYVFTEDPISATSLLHNLHDNTLSEMRNVDVVQFQVIKVCRDILLWKNDFCEETKLDMMELQLRKRWEDIEGVGKSMIAFIKGILAKYLVVNDEVVSRFFIEASRAPPDLQSIMYNHHAYRFVRRFRKNNERRLIGLADPCLEVCPEAELAKVQYQLFPDDMIAILDYALLLQETRNPERALDVVAFFEQALDLAKEEMNELWANKIKIYMAEYLVFEKNESLDRSKGEELYRECELENVKKTSFIYHKLAKYYKNFQKNSERAKEYCKLGLEKDHRNFSCLVDYLKLIRGDAHEMLTVIDRTLEHFLPGDDVVAKLQAIRGCVIWVYQRQVGFQPTEAVKSWIDVLKYFPSYQHHVYDCIKNRQISKLLIGDFESTSSSIPVTVDAVVDYMRRKLWIFTEDRKLVRSFIEKLEKFERRADKDDNWRS